MGRKCFKAITKVTLACQSHCLPILNSNYSIVIGNTNLTGFSWHQYHLGQNVLGTSVGDYPATEKLHSYQHLSFFPFLLIDVSFNHDIGFGQVLDFFVSGNLRDRHILKTSFLLTWEEIFILYFLSYCDLPWKDEKQYDFTIVESVL